MATHEQHDQPTSHTVQTSGGDYAEQDIDKRQGAFIEGGTFQREVIGQQYNYYTYIERPPDRNRAAMLRKVRTLWIDGFLQHSLVEVVQLDLGLVTQPDAVKLPFNNQYQELNQPPRPLPVGTPIIDVFTVTGGALLILGAPGAGKTTLLLELARDLLDQADQNISHPIPIVFNLSSWAIQRLPIEDWMVGELNTRYDVPHKVARDWVTSDALLPLLDGLDEVTQAHRDTCVDAINTYRSKHGLVPVAICSRLADYKTLQAKLRLQGAVMVQPLTNAQITTYLSQAETKLAGLRAALDTDSDLHELAKTPLMLRVMAPAYEGVPSEVLAVPANIEAKRRHLFTTYVVKMFQRRSKSLHYTQKQTIGWLVWLAKQMVHHNQTMFTMVHHNQTMFAIERLQPSWLPVQAHRHYALIARPIFGLVLGISFSLVFGLIFELVFGLVFGLVSSILGGAIGVLFGMMGIRLDKIESVETLSWSWPEIRPTLNGNLIWGMGIVLSIGLNGALHYGMFVGLIGMLGVGLFFLLLIGLGVGLRRGQLETKDKTNQGIYRSIRNAILGGLIVGIPFGLLYGLVIRLTFGLEASPLNEVILVLVGGLVGWLSYGGAASTLHFALRLALWHNRLAPWNYARFLDYCADHIFLHKVGGSYMFIHPMLRDFFASLTDAEIQSITDDKGSSSE